MDTEKVTIHQIIRTIKNIPRTIGIIKDIDKKNFLLIMILTIINGLVPTLILIATQSLINVLASNNISFKFVIINLIIYLLVIFISSILSEAENYYKNKVQIIISYHLNLKIMNKCKQLGVKDFENSQIYDKLQRVQGEINNKPYETFTIILGLIEAITTLISSSIVIVSWRVWTIIPLIILPLLTSIYFLKLGQTEFLVQYNRVSEARKGWYLSYLMTHDNSYKEIKLFNLEEHIINSYKNINQKFLKQDNKLLKNRSMSNFIFETIMQCSSAFVIFNIIISAFMKEILIGNVIGYIRGISLVQNNSKAIVVIIDSIYKNNLYIEQLFDFFSLETDELERDGNKEIIEGEIQNLKIKNLNFKYPTNDKLVLNNINLELKKGERVAIVGPNGCGKSTLVKLISQLYTYNSGEILINDIPTKNIDTKFIRNNIGVLMQDFIKYELSVRENIGFGDIKNLNNNEKIIKSLKKAKINFFKEKLHNNLDKQLGLWFSNGVQLSGGQWQKIALARAIMKDAPIYILDEPSSSLDPISEKEMFDLFFKLTKDKIAIFVSHRLSSVKLADKIIVMDEGTIKAIGTHDELIQECDLYRRMYELEGVKYE